ncbi:MAG TPA: hypothetical protein DIC23_04430 [Planctomycetaceae bacterium]|nr:hypothetical protein [Planctomycetaceae bacterium]
MHTGPQLSFLLQPHNRKRRHNRTARVPTAFPYPLQSVPTGTVFSEWFDPNRLVHSCREVTAHNCTRWRPENIIARRAVTPENRTMNRDAQVGLALAILLIGVVGAMVLRDDAEDSRSKTPAVQDSRSHPERPPASIDSPRRARSNDSPPRVTSTRRLPLPAAPVPEPVKRQDPPPGLSATSSRPSLVALNPIQSSPPPLPSTQPPSRPAPSRIALSTDPRQPGTPPPTVHIEIDRAPQRLQFLPSRHPLTRRRENPSGR